MKAKTVLTYSALLFVAAITAAPFVWLLLTSLKGTEDVFAFPPELWPDEFHLSNYAETWRAVPFGSYIVNSVLVSFATVVSNVLLASLAAYPLARMEFKGKPVFFVLILSTMMVPEQVIMIPLYQLTLQLGLLNTLTGLVVPFSVNAFGIFLMRQFYLAVPKELEDAAVIDGCSPFRIWWSVMVPLSKPAIATLAVFTFVASWSSFLWPLVILQESAKFTLPVGLSYLMGAFSANFKFVAAGAVIAIIPVLLVYVFMQRYFIEGILSGGVKG
jgi:putative chitobiose transport system permease protein